jgi:hypothetical protein
MVDQISKQLNIMFLIHFFVSILFGIVFLIFVEAFVAFIQWPYLDPVVGRLLGAALIGFGATSLLAWRETEWAKVKIVVQMEIVWCAIGSIICLVSVFLFPLPFFTWIIIIILIFFLIIFAWYYFMHEKD